jgi:hypothetical protein
MLLHSVAAFVCSRPAGPRMVASVLTQSGGKREFLADFHPGQPAVLACESHSAPPEEVKPYGHYFKWQHAVWAVVFGERRF